MADTLKFLANYTKHHFAEEEEEVMLGGAFPEYERHKSHHQKLLQDLVDILVNIKKGKPINAYELIDFLVDWLKNHIINEDLRIGKHIAALGRDGYLYPCCGMIPILVRVW